MQPLFISWKSSSPASSPYMITRFESTRMSSHNSHSQTGCGICKSHRWKKKVVQSDVSMLQTPPSQPRICGGAYYPLHVGHYLGLSCKELVKNLSWHVLCMYVWPRARASTGPSTVNIHIMMACDLQLRNKESHLLAGTSPSCSRSSWVPPT